MLRKDLPCYLRKEGLEAGLSDAVSELLCWYSVPRLVPTFPDH